MECGRYKPKDPRAGRFPVQSRDRQRHDTGIKAHSKTTDSCYRRICSRTLRQARCQVPWRRSHHICIHHSLPLKTIGRAMHGNVEAQSISIIDSPKTCLNLINLYIPPKADSTDISWLSINDRTLIAGDLNGHSPCGRTSDNHTTDSMGEQIEDLMAQRNLSCLNTGHPC